MRSLATNRRKGTLIKMGLKWPRRSLRDPDISQETHFRTLVWEWLLSMGMKWTSLSRLFAYNVKRGIVIIELGHWKHLAFNIPDPGSCNGRPAGSGIALADNWKSQHCHSAAELALPEREHWSMGKDCHVSIVKLIQLLICIPFIKTQWVTHCI